jgi:acetyl esterase
MNGNSENPNECQPDATDIAYGPHERNIMDLYKAPGPGPHPLLLYIHGGGFMNGDKQRINKQLFTFCLQRGISVISISYRLSQHAIYPAPFHDGRRALQYIRHHATQFNIDPTRIAAAGSSAGAGISSWLAFRPDMADPNNDDPVLRESTRLRCIVTTEGQTTYDPRFISRVVGGNAHTHRALAQLFGVSTDIWPELDDEAIARVEDGAAINFLTKDDPPVFGIYKRENRPPTDEDDPNYGIHHPRFGFDLKTKMDALGIECTIHNDPQMEDDPEARKTAHTLASDFLAKELKK